MSNTAKSIEQTIQYIQSLLPVPYKITWGDNRKNVREKLTNYFLRCVSETGINDEENWELVFEGFKEWFGNKFIEVDHNTCYNHKDFYIYFKP